MPSEPGATSAPSEQPETLGTEPASYFIESLPAAPPPEPPRYAESLALAIAYAEAASRAGTYPRIGEDGTSIGYVRGAAEIIQVIDEMTVLLVTKRDMPLVLSGINTAGLVDGNWIGLDTDLLLYTGPFSYTSVLGAKTTVRSFSVCNPDDLLAAARYRVERTRTELDTLKASRVAQVVEARRQLRMWEAGAAKHEQAAEPARVLRERLKELGPVSDEEVTRFENDLKDLSDILAAETATLSWLRFKGEGR